MMTRTEFETELWARIGKRGDFPALRSSIDSIVESMQNEQASTAQLAATILADFTLTQKVIRLANSAMYAAFGGDVTTVSRAIMILGVETVGHLALGSQLLDSFFELAGDSEDAADELQRARIASEFARTITSARNIRDGEEAIVCALFQYIARLLVIMYFPRDWREARALVEDRGLTEDQALERVVGATLPQIGALACARWGLPATIQETLRQSEFGDEDGGNAHVNWLSAVARLSSEVATHVHAGGNDEAITELIEQYADSVGLDAEVLATAGRQISAAHCNESSQMIEGPNGMTSSSSIIAPGKPADAAHRLEAAHREIEAASREASVPELIQLVMETLMQSLGLPNVVAFFLNHQTKTYNARLAFGQEVQARRQELFFDQAFVPNVFHLALTSGKVRFVARAQDPDIANSIPRWYAEQFPQTQSFVLLPVQFRSKPVALFYGDWAGTSCAESLTAQETAWLHRIGEEVSKAMTAVANAAS
jgi:HD-like signal output (HDOD) protein